MRNENVNKSNKFIILKENNCTVDITGGDIQL